MSDQLAQPPAPVAAPPVPPSSDHGAIIDTLQAKVTAQDALIAKLRGVEQDLTKKANRGERFEGVVRSQLDAMKVGVDKSILLALDGLALEKQLDLLPMLKPSAQPEVAPAPTVAPIATVAPAPAPPAPAPPAPAPPAPPPPGQPQLASSYDIERTQLMQAGQWNSKTAADCARKHSTAIG